MAIAVNTTRDGDREVTRQIPRWGWGKEMAFILAQSGLNPVQGVNL